jgi:hypothetical protein
MGETLIDNIFKMKLEENFERHGVARKQKIFLGSLSLGYIVAAHTLYVVWQNLFI